MWGGIFSGGSQIIGGLIPKTSGFKVGQHEFMYGTQKSKTIASFNNAAGSSRFRIDIGAGTKATRMFNGLHWHFGKTSAIRQLHRFVLPAVVNAGLANIGIYSWRYGFSRLF